MRRNHASATLEHESPSEPVTEPSGSEPEPAMQRAEHMVDQFGAQVGDYATWLGQGMLRLAARAREELEDMWAEAQHLREQAAAPREEPSEEEEARPRRASHSRRSANGGR